MTTASPQVVTPTVRQAGRRARYWVIAAIVALVITLFSFLAVGNARQGGPPLDPTSASPTGSLALAEVLRDHGIRVTTTDTMLATTKAASPDDTTIFVVDSGGYLSSDQLRELGRASTRLIVVNPTFDQLDGWLPEVAQDGSVTATLKADCDFGPVQRAGTVTGTGSGFRLIASNADAQTCLASAKGELHSLIIVNRGVAQAVVLGTATAFTNEHVLEEGNAAFALGLLGEHSHLVWYLPNIAEAPGGPGIAELTPPALSLILTLAVLTTIAAAFWRGRRLGPLVVENLPVVVRASETMEGRARLYAASSARLRALDALRIGALDRLGHSCGLPTSASTDDIIAAVAALVRRPRADLIAVLRDREPASDAELVRLSDELLLIEREVAATLNLAASPPATSRPQHQPQPQPEPQPENVEND